VANFREGPTEADHTRNEGGRIPFVSPEYRFSSVVDSIGFGVTPNPDMVGRFGTACQMYSGL
jgi:hypothetical protein